MVCAVGAVLVYAGRWALTAWTVRYLNREAKQRVPDYGPRLAAGDDEATSAVFLMFAFLGHPFGDLALGIGGFGPAAVFTLAGAADEDPRQVGDRGADDLAGQGGGRVRRVCSGHGSVFR